jgi:N-formylglutamate deformylase
LLDPLVVAFEEARVDGATFRHREHLRVAWCYLQVMPLEEALARYVRYLGALVVALGVPDKLHRTMTWAWLALLDDARDRAPHLGFDELLAANPQLLARDALLAYYPRQQLESEVARRRFVLPERG